MSKSILSKTFIVSFVIILISCSSTRKLTTQETQNILQQTSCVMKDSVLEEDKTIDLTKEYPKREIQGSKIISYEINEKTLSFKTIQDTITEFEQLLWYDAETGKITASFTSVGKNFFGRNYSFNEDGSVFSSSNHQYNTKICPFQAIALAKNYINDVSYKYSWTLNIDSYKKRVVWVVSSIDIESKKEVKFYIDSDTGELLKVNRRRN